MVGFRFLDLIVGAWMRIHGLVLLGFEPSTNHPEARINHYARAIIATIGCCFHSTHEPACSINMLQTRALGRVAMVLVPSSVQDSYLSPAE